MNYYRCQANSITFHFLTVTRKVNFLKVLVSMFLFPTTAHRGRWLWYFCLLSDYTIRKSLHLPHTAQTSKISLLFTKAHRWLLDFLMLLFKSIDSYPIKKTVTSEPDPANYLLAKFMLIILFAYWLFSHTML